MEAALTAVANKVLVPGIGSVQCERSSGKWTDMAMLKDPRPNAQGLAHFVDIVENVPDSIDYRKVPLGSSRGAV